MSPLAAEVLELAAEIAKPLVEEIAEYLAGKREKEDSPAVQALPTELRSRAAHHRARLRAEQGG